MIFVCFNYGFYLLVWFVLNFRYLFFLCEYRLCKLKKESCNLQSFCNVVILQKKLPNSREAMTLLKQFFHFIASMSNLSYCREHYRNCHTKLFCMINATSSIIRFCSICHSFIKKIIYLLALRKLI